jgi:hypothetical protein
MRTLVLLVFLSSILMSCKSLNQSLSASNINASPQAMPSISVEPSVIPTGYLDTQTLFAKGRYKNCTDGLPIVGSSIVEYIYFENIDQLIKQADLIVVGRPLTELGPETTLRSMKAKKNYDYFEVPLNQSLVVTDSTGASNRSADWTLTSFVVQEVLKGNPTSSKIQILEPAIVISGKTIAKHIRVTGSFDSDDYTPLKKGKKYLLFLQKTLPTPTSFFNPEITYTTPFHQGLYNLDGGDCAEALLAKRNPQHIKLLSQVKAKYPKLFSNKKMSPK